MDIQLRPQVFLLATELPNVSLPFQWPGGQKTGARLLALGQALVTSPLWTKMHQSVLVVRLFPKPMLGLVGLFDAADQFRIEAIRWQTAHALSRLRYVSYEQAQADCEVLAAQLLERFDRSELRKFSFMAIPRGGFIVLGMLAYILGIKSSQLECNDALSNDVPLVVVDDCSISGARFGRFLRQNHHNRIIFAPLYSPSELRLAIEQRESRVMACLSAQDMYDATPEEFGDACEAWRERWAARSVEREYWIGLTDHVCFAWNEPDISIWNPVTERVEPGWRVVPPQLCLKNRVFSEASACQLQVQPEGRGPLQPAEPILFGELSGQILIGNIKTGQSFGLEGVAADMWRAIIRYGNLEDVVSSLLKDYDVDKSSLRTDVQIFVTKLLQEGLLEQLDDPSAELPATPVRRKPNQVVKI